MNCLILLSVLLSTSFGLRYDGCKVYKLEIETVEQYQFVHKFVVSSIGPDYIWKCSVGPGVCDVVVPSSFESYFIQIIEHESIITISKNVVPVTIILEEKGEVDIIKYANDSISYKRYYKYHEIEEILELFSNAYPDIVTLERSGETYEKRHITLVKISKNPKANNPIILIDAGIHAREWISPAVAMFLINELVINRKETSFLYDNVDWYIIPVLNPDGYVYSHTTQRSWRNNRSVSGKQAEKVNCTGVNLNRNFDVGWQISEKILNMFRVECSDSYNYAGLEPFSEVESRFLRDIVLKYKDQIKLYLSLHSYGNLVLYPLLYSNITTKDRKDHIALAATVAEAIAGLRGTRYMIERSETIPGTTMDWVYEKAGIKHSYTIELPNHMFGFELPPSEIYSTSTEMFEGFKVFHEFIETNYAPNSSSYRY